VILLPAIPRGTMPAPTRARTRSIRYRGTLLADRGSLPTGQTQYAA
jgi:hypothetical protein